LKLSEQFYDKYKCHLDELDNQSGSNKAYLFSDGLYQKYYRSYVLTALSGNRLVANLVSNYEVHVVYDLVVNITKQCEKYLVSLASGRNLLCNKLIIASGRAASITSMMSEIGEKYHSQQDILKGCRVTFDPVPAEIVACNQLDFKVKHRNLCQTYCFNYRGNLHSYQYNDYTIFTGTLNANSSVGNCFIGKRIYSSPSEVFKDYYKNTRVSYNDFCTSKRGSQIEHDLLYFLKLLQHHLNLDFYDLHFPAFEQFWPRPILKHKSLESMNLNNVYYVGDSSGISFGVLQSYVTANYLMSFL